MRLLFCLALLICTSARAREDVHPIYILHCNKAEFNPIGKQQAVLILHSPDQTVPYIYSQPTRRVGAERLVEFMRVWAPNGILQYDQEPPTGHLLYFDKHKREYINLLISIQNAEYNQDVTSLSFQLGFFIEDPYIPENIGEVTLFIDCFPYCA